MENNKKKKLITAGLLIVVVILMASIFYISFVLSKSSQEPSATVSPQKVKASNVSYTKLIALNQGPNSLPTSTPPPTATVTPKQSPTPTEIVLAKAGGSPTPATGSSVTKPATVSATTIKSLPVTGVVTNSLIFMAVAGLLIFFSFIF